MCEPVIITFLPFLLLLILAAWGIGMTKACKFQRPEDPIWPFAENLVLALELAGSIEFVNKVLGTADTYQDMDHRADIGSANRDAARRLQKLDFVFIVFYVLLFISVPWVRSGWSRGVIVIIVLALFTGIFDVIENYQVLRMLRNVEGSSAKLFGQTKWFFYFTTLGAEGSLFFFEHAATNVEAILGKLLGAALIAIAVGGIISSVKGSFEGISSATKFSVPGLLALALSPLLPVMACYPYSLTTTAQYAVLMRVPLLLGLVLFALPFIAFHSSAKTLLRGLFDLTPLSLFVVTITSLAVSGTACVTSYIILNNARARFELGPFYQAPSARVWVIIMVLLSLPLIGFSVRFSAQQKHSLGRLVIAALSGASLIIAAAYILIRHGSEYVSSVLPFLSEPGLKNYLSSTGLFKGYVEFNNNHDAWATHLFAFAAFWFTFILYAIVGVYGWLQLGRKRTVPALCSALMLMLMVGWLLSGIAFFFDFWRIPTLLIVAVVGIVTAQSNLSDHFYTLQDHSGSAPNPAVTITASKQSRVIVVAASGGGIQAGAWAAQVLYGLSEDLPDRFQESLRMISSVSGGSVGNAFFVNWLANKDVARRPNEAAVISSLDEVAWGLAWPDFLRAIFPWLFGRFTGRGRALERAWLLNSTTDLKTPRKIDESLSKWNEMVTAGKIPAVVMNATITETGQRLVFATTRLNGRTGGGALMDATELHTINGKQRDVGVVTAARLSATFPYVTPASRSDGPGPQPHVVDGGYYDNYGMVTLVEWLDEALEGARDEIKSVLVIQIHGAPDFDFSDERHAKTRGWFYQAFAPVATLISVRSAAQVAHNKQELELLQQKWSAAGVPIHTVTFKFSKPNAPLSWHLTPQEVEDINSAWRDGMCACRRSVRMFLDGSDSLACGCATCVSVSSASLEETA